MKKYFYFGIVEFPIYDNLKNIYYIITVNDWISVKGAAESVAFMER